MAKYRIYDNNDPDVVIHEDFNLDIPVSIHIGETIIYSGLIYKVVDIVHHIADSITITDIRVEKNK